MFFKKKVKKNIPVQLKKSIWELYIGIGVTQALCPLCGLQKLDNKVNSGFEAAHIVADKFLDENHQLNELYLYPTCEKCNNECVDLTIFDFLYCRGRLDQLRRMISAIYNHFCTAYKDELVYQEKLSHKILDHLYGNKRFPSGGGIVNRQQIYKIALQIQFKELQEKAQHLTKKLSKISQQMENVLSHEIKTKILEI